MREVESIHQSHKGKPGTTWALPELGTRSTSAESVGFGRSLTLRYSEETETVPKKQSPSEISLMTCNTVVLAVVATHGILTA